MRGVNHVFLIGNLGKDPELIYVDGNIPVAKFPLATTETYKDKRGFTIPQTEWHNIVMWRGLAELATKYLHKGSLVHIEGSLKTRSWEDKDRHKRFVTEIIASNLVMLDKRNTESRSDYKEVPTGTDYIHTDYNHPNPNELNDELPF